jgi:hypothetical protein
MRATLLLSVLFMSCLGSAAQDSVKLNRTFKVGDSERYNVALAMTMAGGDATIDLVMKQTVKKVYDNGDADIETALSDIKVVIFGSPMAQPSEPPSVQRVSKLGTPVGLKTSKKAKAELDILKLAAVMLDRDLTIGQEVPVEIVDPKDAKSKMKGTAKVLSVKDGIAKVETKLDVWNETTTTDPLKAALVWTMDVSSAVPNVVEGTLSNMPQLGDGAGPTEVKIKMVRVVKK